MWSECADECVLKRCTLKRMMDLLLAGEELKVYLHVDFEIKCRKWIVVWGWTCVNLA